MSGAYGRDIGRAAKSLDVRQQKMAESVSLAVITGDGG